MDGIVQPCFLLIVRVSHCVIFSPRFYGEAAEFVRRDVGAKRLVIFDHTIRAKRNDNQQTDEHATSQRAPVMLVHCDYTPNSGPLRVRQLLPGEADELLKRRVAFYNFWKPLRGNVEEKPLAMCDVTSSTDEDFLTIPRARRRNLRAAFSAAPLVVGTCVYLASTASDYVTGAVIPVDGGYTATDGLDRD
jgi:hypothetical protein